MSDNTGNGLINCTDEGCTFTHTNGTITIYAVGESYDVDTDDLVSDPDPATHKITTTKQVKRFTCNGDGTFTDEVHDAVPLVELELPGRRDAGLLVEPYF